MTSIRLASSFLSRSLARLFALFSGIVTPTG